MKHINFLFLLLLAALHSSYLKAQPPTDQSRRNQPVMDLFYRMPIVRSSAGVVGNVYQNPAWNSASLALYGNEKTIEGVKARYNIYFEELNVQTPQGDRAMDGTKLKSFVLKDSTDHLFVNAKDYSLEGVQLKGFLEVLADGKVQLLKRYIAIIKNPDYTPALNSGSKDPHIELINEFYFTNDKNLLPVKSKKKLLAAFGDKASQMEEYIKSQRLSTNQAGLTKIFQYYNSL